MNNPCTGVDGETLDHAHINNKHSVSHLKCTYTYVHIIHNIVICTRV